MSKLVWFAGRGKFLKKPGTFREPHETWAYINFCFKHALEKLLEAGRPGDKKGDARIPDIPISPPAPG